MDLSPALQKQIAQLGARYGATKIVLFGSRARGDNHPRSVHDLAIYGMPEGSRLPSTLRSRKNFRPCSNLTWYISPKYNPRCCKISKGWCHHYGLLL